jgi:putative PIN family toxin of toxin-antitoxin system
VKTLQIVIDTNVLVSASRSTRGASFRLLRLLGDSRFEISVSVPLVIEYEKAVKRTVRRGELSAGDVDAILDFICAVARHREIYYLWRPLLRDPKDDMVLELAVAGGCDVIVTYNQKDFTGAEAFGIGVLTPKEFLHKKGDV